MTEVWTLLLVLSGGVAYSTDYETRAQCVRARDVYPKAGEQYDGQRVLLRECFGERKKA